MCGISGAWQPNIAAREDALAASLGAIVHRGPDDQGTYRGGNAILGMRRLGVIDLEGGQQPIYNEDGTVALVFNGEIYNYRELMADLKARGHRFRSHSDSEVLVHLYEEKGEAMLADLRGMFAFALHDRRDDSLFLARDRFGKKPLYYTQPAAGGLLFASELKALRPLARASGERWTINQQAIYDYLSLGVVPQPSTVFRGVYALPPAHWMRFRAAKLEVRRYWQLDFLPKLSLSYPEAQERARDLIGEAVRLRLRSDVPLGVFLSGGVDSSVVAYEAAREVGENLQTFTVAMPDARFDESAVAARTARDLGVQNTVLPLELSPLRGLEQLVRHYDQPYADSSAIPSLEISRLARQHVTVVLNGDGGDEVFAGYRRSVAALRSARFERVPPGLTGLAARALRPFAAARRSPLGFAARFARGLALSPAERYLAWTTDMLRETDKAALWRGEPQLPTEDRIASFADPALSPLDRQLAADLNLNLLSDLLVKMDMATMAHSLEGRSPLLDHQVAQFAARLPDAYRVRGGVPKAVLRDAYREHLPQEVVSGAKRGFEIPLAAWLRGELRPVLRDTLGSPTARVRAFVDGAFVDALLAERAMADRNWAYLVYALLVLELWLLEEERRE